MCQITSIETHFVNGLTYLLNVAENLGIHCDHCILVYISPVEKSITIGGHTGCYYDKNGIGIFLKENSLLRSNADPVSSYLPVHFPFYLTGFLKISEVGEGFSCSEEGLYNREGVPGVAINIPGHLRCHLIDIPAPCPQYGKYFMISLSMMFLYLFNSVFTVPEKGSMAGQYRVYV